MRTADQLTEPVAGIFQSWKSVVLLFIAAFAGWQSPNYVMSEAPLTDSGIFIAVAHHMRAGKVLYRDVWDHKPPMIHFLNRAAIAGHEVGVNAVRYMEKGFGAAMAVLLFLIVLAAFGNVWIAFFSTLYFLLLLYNPVVFEGGNLTEEYGACFFLAMVACSLPTWTARYQRLCSFGVGLFAGLVCLTKEPYLLSCIPWVIASWVIVWKGWRNTLKVMSFQILGVMMAIMPFMIYFLWHSALTEWVKVIAYNFSYSELNKATIMDLAKSAYYYAAGRICYQSYFGLFIAITGIVSLTSLVFQRTTRFFSWVAGFSFFFSLVAASLSNKHLGHYYMMPIPAWVLFTSAGACFVCQVGEWAYSKMKVLKTINPSKFIALNRLGLVIVSLGILVIVAVPFARGLERRVVMHDYSFLKSGIHLFSGATLYSSSGDIKSLIPLEVLRREGLWAQGKYSRYYAESGAFSPTIYIYAPNHLFIDTALESKAVRLQKFRSGLESRPPALLVFSFFTAYLPENDTFLLTHYTRVNRPDIGELVLVRNDLVPMVKSAGKDKN